MNYKEEFKEIELEINNKYNLDDVRTKLSTMIDEIVPIKEDTQNTFSFDVFIEYFIFNSLYNQDKKFTLIEEPVYKMYYLLALSYIREDNLSDAKKYFKEALKWNPYDISSYINLIEIYNFEKDYEKTKIVIFEMQKYIYFYKDLGLFYKYLGDYLFNVKNYEIANIVYSYSLNFIDDSSISTKLLNIAGFLNRPVKKYEKEDCVINLKNLKIPTNVSDNIIDNLYELYDYYKNNKTDFASYKFIKMNLSKLTEDEVFSDYKTIKNTYFNISFNIPESWKLVNKLDYNKNSTGKFTLYVISVNNTNVINFDVLKDANDNLINEYKQFRSYIVNQGFSLKLEDEIEANGIKYIQSITQKKLLNEYITIINCVFILKNKLFNISIPSHNSYDEINIKNIYNDKNAIRLKNIINSIQKL